MLNAHSLITSCLLVLAILLGANVYAVDSCQLILQDAGREQIRSGLPPKLAFLVSEKALSKLNREAFDSGLMNLREQIAKSTNDNPTNLWIIHDDYIFRGRVIRDASFLTIEISDFRNKKVWYGSTVRKFDPLFANMLASVFRGVADMTANDVGIKSVKIVAKDVINKRLIETLSTLGFERKDYSEKPYPLALVIRAGQIFKDGEDLTLDIVIER